MYIDRITTLVSSCIEAYRTCLWLIQNRRKISEYILIGSHVMNGGGAPVVLWETIKLLSDMGYKIVVVSPGYGDLVSEMRKREIDVLICKRFKFLLRKLVSHFKWPVAIMNTIEMHKWVEELPAETHIIWWLHEGKTYAENYKGAPGLFDRKNVTAVCVSEWSRTCLAKIGVNRNTSILYYGIREKELQTNIPHRKLTFVMIGSICRRKRVLDFLNAILLLSDEVSKNCRFIIVGKALPTEPDYMKLFKKKLSECPDKIEYIEFIPNEKIYEIYQSADVLVCASDDDPLPVVVTEAFMYKKVALISDGVGQYSLIEDGVNGFSYCAGDVKTLKEKIELIFFSRYLLKEIAQQGYQIYRRYFTIDSHKCQLEALMKKR